MLMKTVVDRMYVKEVEGRGGGGGEKKGMNKVKVKASGGIKGLGDWKKMISAGAERVGTSAGVMIMREAQQEVEEGQSFYGEGMNDVGLGGLREVEASSGRRRSRGGN